MKTLFVLSDTHGNLSAIDKVRPIMEEADYVVHLGDYARDVSSLYATLGGKLRVVDGNCDFFSAGEKEGVMEVEGVRVLFCHGHRYGVKRGTEKLVARAKELNCTLALYGHTHSAEIRTENGVTLVCPGSMERFSTKPSYCYVVLHEGKITANIVEIF